MPEAVNQCGRGQWYLGQAIGRLERAIFAHDDLDTLPSRPSPTVARVTEALAALQHPRSMGAGRKPRLLALAVTVNPGEECDRTNFDGHHCRLRGHRGGYLTCTPECRIDASQCDDEAHALRLDGGALEIRWLDALDSHTLEFWMKPAVFEGQGSGQSLWVGNGITSSVPESLILPFDILRRHGLGNRKTFPDSDAWHHVAIANDVKERVIYVNGRMVARGERLDRRPSGLRARTFEGFLDECGSGARCDRSGRFGARCVMACEGTSRISSATGH
jgi:hypothetical protein